MNKFNVLFVGTFTQAVKDLIAEHICKSYNALFAETQSEVVEIWSSKKIKCCILTDWMVGSDGNISFNSFDTAKNLLGNGYEVVLVQIDESDKVMRIRPVTQTEVQLYDRNFKELFKYDCFSFLPVSFEDFMAFVSGPVTVSQPLTKKYEIESLTICNDEFLCDRLDEMLENSGAFMQQGRFVFGLN